MFEASLGNLAKSCLKRESWECSSVGSIFLACTQGSGLNPQYCKINKYISTLGYVYNGAKCTVCQWGLSNTCSW